ncbi:hypothetical protein D9M70_499280 [compost metagenome]
MGGERAAGRQGLGRTRQQWIVVVLQGGQGAPGARQVGDIEQVVEVVAARLQLRLRQFVLGLVGQGLQQAIQLQRRLFLPVELLQALDQVVLLLVEEEALGQAEVQRVAGVDLGGGEAEEQAEFARQAREEPAAADIRVQADADFRHRQAAARRDDAYAGALHQAHAAAHHVAVGPAQQGFRVGVDAVVEAVFVGEEARRQRRHLAGMGAAGLDQPDHVAAGAEGLGPVAAQQHADDRRVVGPDAQLAVQRLDHRQRQGVQAALGIQAGDADARAVLAGQFLETHVHAGFSSFICCASGHRAFPGTR